MTALGETLGALLALLEGPKNGITPQLQERAYGVLRRHAPCEICSGSGKCDLFYLPPEAKRSKTCEDCKGRGWTPGSVDAAIGRAERLPATRAFGGVQALDFLLCGDNNPARAMLFAEMLACFTALTLRLVGALGLSTVVVCSEAHPFDDLWEIWDNEGSLRVARINTPGTVRLLYYEEGEQRLDGATLATRLHATITGTTIDFGKRCPELLQAPSIKVVVTQLLEQRAARRAPCH